MPTLRRNYGEPLQVIITEGVFSRKHHTVVHRTDEESSMEIYWGLNHPGWESGLWGTVG